MPPKEGASRKRAYHPKSRTGCWSCRSRKVKCDEGKPECQRCKNYGMKCAGYSPVRPIFSAYCSLVENESQRTIHRPPSIPLMSSMLQEQYFNIFFTKTGNAIVPYFEPFKWVKEHQALIMDACSSEPALFHAIVAIGALEKTYEVVRIDKTTETSNVNPHHEFALQEYGKAIKLLRKTTEGGLSSLRNVLLIAVSIICFEELHGNYESSTQQILVMLQMIEEWKTQNDPEDKHGFGFSSPAPSEIPDMLIQIFGRLEIQTMLFVDTRPAETHVRLKSSGAGIVRCMPEVFDSVMEARLYLELVMRRFMHWIAEIGHEPRTPDDSLEEYPESETYSNETLWPVSDDWHSALRFQQSRKIRNPSARAESPLPRTVDELPNPEFHKTSTLGTPYSEISVVMKPSFFSKPACSSSSPFPYEFYEEQADYLAELNTWLGAFDPLYAATQDPEHPNIVGLSLLKLHYLLSYITLRAKLSPNESAYDQYTPQFTEALSLCSTILTKLDSQTENWQSSLHFTFDQGVLVPLYLIMTKCRVSSIRKQALLLTQTHQRREGNWDSELTAATGRWVIREEEEGTVEDGSVPEKARVSHINLKSHNERRRAEVSCQRWSEKEGRFMVYKDNIVW